MGAVMKVPTEFTAIDKFTSVVSKMTAGVSNFSSSTSAAIDRFNTKANKVAGNMAIAGGAILAPLGVAVKSAIDFEDKMADVAKTTGLNSKESEIYGKAILDMSKKTRTSISQLQDIGVVAGTIGVAKDELVAFTKAGNEFAIALGSDFGSTEFAVEQVAKLKNLFKETRGIDIATSMTKAGSAINEVSNIAGSAKNINDFMLRIGALPDAMKPAIEKTAALGGFFEDAGLSSEIAAGGFSNLILVAGKNLSGFASQMGISVKSAKELYATDPTEFAIRFSKSLNKLSPDKLAVKLDELKIGSQESIKVVGALGSNYEKLNNVINVSTKAFKDGTSITEEAKKKNDTLAGKLAMAKNNMEALSITVGTKLAPILTKLIDKVTPIIEKFGKWADDNPELVKTIADIGLGLLALSATIRAITIATTLYKGAIFLYTNAVKAAQVAQWLWNATMWANPIGLIVLGIIALIAWLGFLISKWDSFGASILMITGPIGWIINLIMSLRKHWDSIVEAFKTDGLIAGFKRLGAVILDSVLYPIQQMLDLLSKIPGVDKLINPVKSGIVVLREALGVAEAPETKQAKATANATVNGEVNVNVKTKNGTTAETTTKNKGGIPVLTTSTQGAF